MADHLERHFSHDLDEERLEEFGIKQELNRDWSLLHNFGISFSIIVRGLCCLAVMLVMLIVALSILGRTGAGESQCIR